MKVITGYPVIIDSQRKSPNDYYLNLTDEQKAAGQGGAGSQKAKKKFDKDKAAEVYGKVKESGVLDSLATLVGLNKPPASVTVEASKEPLKEGMSTGTKVALIGGGLLLVGGLIYWATKK
jgi:hypothetical protein